MSDLLLYATTLENHRLRDKCADSLYGSDDGTSVDFSTELGPAETPNISGGVTEASFVTNWKAQIGPYSVEAAARPNQLKICDGSGYYRCGAHCSWTVPSGVTSIRVQQWAAGGGSGTNCCCGGAPFGPSGSFALYDMPVSSGQTVCFCASCAYCCYAYQTTPGDNSSYPTFVYNASTGQCMRSFTPPSCFCSWNCDAVLSGYIGSSACGNAFPNSSCSAQSCSGWNFCWDTGADNVDVPYIFSRCNYNYNCQDNASYALTNLYSIPGIWPKAYIGSSLQENSFTVSPPVYGFESLTCCEQWWNNATCSGCCRAACVGIQQGPGFGGYASSVNGGCNACGGDPGGTGMICVSWC